MTYKNMAHVYDRLMEDAPYDEWIHFLSYFSHANKHPNILDVGCGTGEIPFLLEGKGYNVSAFDQSVAMIEIAKEKKNEKQSTIHFFQENAVNFSLDRSFYVIISFCDVYNYLIEENDLTSSFQSVYSHLENNGLFIFDVHSLAYVEMLKEKEIFSEIYDDLAYVWLCYGENKGEINHDLTFFVQDESGYFKRFDEFHVQKTYDVDFYKSKLLDTGFKQVDVYADFSTNQTTINADTKRIFFVCQK